MTTFSVVRKARGKRKSYTELTARQIEHLIYGWCLGNSFPFDSEDHRRECWLANREHLMSIPGGGYVPGVFGSRTIKKNYRPDGLGYDRKGRPGKRRAKNY